MGKAVQQTFAARLRQHRSWLASEEGISVYLGRLLLPERHTAADGWAGWEADIALAERILIYKYSPHYNSIAIAERPFLNGFERVILLHVAQRHLLHARDVAPEDLE